MKDATWSNVLKVLGRAGDHIMIDLILDCGLFVGVKVGKDSFYQLSGSQRLSCLTSLAHPGFRCANNGAADAEEVRQLIS